jgi:hypothetical protein
MIILRLKMSQEGNKEFTYNQQRAWVDEWLGL